MLCKQLIIIMIFLTPTFLLPNEMHSGAASPIMTQTTQLGTNVTIYCTSRNATALLPCTKPLIATQKTSSSYNYTAFYHYNASSVYLDHMLKVEGWSGRLTSFVSLNQLPLPTNEIYRTAHWIWFADASIYSQYKQNIDPMLNWPETSYSQIATWLGVTLPSGGFSGGRHALYVYSDTSGCCGAWSSGGNMGFQVESFIGIPDWPWVVIPHEMTNSITGIAVVPNGGWPPDWWSDGRSPFPAMVAVNVEKSDEAAYGVSYWQQHDISDQSDSSYVMFRDNLQGVYGWEIFQNAFAAMRNDALRLDTPGYTMHSEYESSNWYQLHYLKSHVVAYYLSRAVGVDLSATLNQGTVGQKPPNWSDPFNPYQMSLSSVKPTAQIQQPSGTSGVITLTATASDPDWGVNDVAFWYSTDNNVFYSIGTDTNGADGWSVLWDTRNSIIGQQQIWVMAVSHDMSNFESPWSVSSPFTINNEVVVTTTTSVSSTSSTSSTSSASTTSTFPTATASTTLPVITNSPLVTGTTATTSTVTGPTAGTTTKTSTSILTSTSTSLVTSSVGQTTTQTGVTSISTGTSSTTSTGTAFTATTTGGTASVTEMYAFNVLLTLIFQELHQLAKEFLQLIGVQAVAMPVGQQVNQVVVTVLTPTTSTTALTSMTSTTVTTSSASTTTQFPTIVTSSSNTVTQPPVITNTLTTTTTTTGTVPGTGTTTFTSPLVTSFSTTSSASSFGETITETGTATTGIGSSETTTSTGTVLSTTTSGGTVTVSETDTFQALWTNIIQELHLWADEILQVLGFHVTATLVGQQVNEVIVTTTSPAMNGAGSGDFVVWRPTAGYWFVQHPDGSMWATGWGTNGDVPLLGNFSNNGLRDFAIWRPSNGYWFVLRSSNGYSTGSPMILQWGKNGDTPLLGDVDGDGHDDLIMWTPSTGTWSILKSGTSYNPVAATVIQYGNKRDIPLVGDVDGDGRADLCVWRTKNGMFFCLLSTQNYNLKRALAKQWGTSGDQPFIADMDGDGKADFVVWRPGSGTWFMLLSSTGYNPAQAKIVLWGMSTDTPFVAKNVVGVWRNGVWFILQGPDFTTAQIAAWGTSGDNALYSR